MPPQRVHQLVAAFESVIAAELTHPALAAPLATGIAGVEAYLVQDYVGAESLDLAVREYGPAPPADALRVATHLAGALDFAAAASVVHGSLHPRDILLSTDDTRLTGIGVARALAIAGVTAPVRRPYAAPERIEGATWDRRADVFSLAALMHEFMWGRRITGAGAQAADSLTAIAGGDLTALRATFDRALAEDPGARFATALEFAEALQNAFPGVSAAPDAPPGKKRSVRKVDRAPRVEPPMEVEPKLPLDAVLDNFDLRAGESARFADVEVAPAIVEGAAPHAAAVEPPITAPAGFITGDREPMSALERTRSAVWPLVLSLIVGVAIGFAGGYFTGSRDRPAPPTLAGGREFTESAVPEASKATAINESSVRLQPDQPNAKAPATPRAVPSAPVRLKPDTTAAAEPVASKAAADVAPGRLLVRSTPVGATVSVDGKEYGRTPATVRDLATGAHQVIVSRAGYTSSEQRIVLTRTRPAQSMVFTLERPSRAAAAPPPSAPLSRSAGSSGALTVDSRPSGAKVYLDGTLMGNTPLSLQTVNSGDHAVRIEREGYKPWSAQVRIVASEQNRVTASLER